MNEKYVSPAKKNVKMIKKAKAPKKVKYSK